MQHRKIAFIGAGNMSRSIISGLIETGYPASHILACNPTDGKLQDLKRTFGVNTSQSNAEALSFAQVVILAVKPQLMAGMLETLQQQSQFGEEQLVISIAAGIRLERLQEMLRGHQRVIRTMPNTPSQLGMGVTGLYAAPEVAGSDRAFCQALLNCVGETLWTQDEEQLNGVIAAAGSAPAYFFLMMEAMIDHARSLGFNEQEARMMVQQTALGAAEMARQNPEVSLAELRAQVTSRGGATACAIDSFEQHNFRQGVANAMNAAIARASEMEQQF
ncbi:pyrroline-5-carboxylate reductase [Dongshaea marina]|uniref:pyrroline-5-carboxylate reductase n=1 Tax=Dongshaea marina TaxID=2047966 RepID=UPI000D3EB636|nr:pyrroline-5-carboxylate reductase [Dongshaea marina]